MTRLPPSLQGLVDDVVERSGVEPGRAGQIRADLEQHLRDGLDAGRTPEELMARFGRAEDVAPMLAEATTPQGDGFLQRLGTDLRLAVRNLLASPTLAVTSAVVLALGIGANTVVFTVVNELLLAPLPVAEPETLVDVWPDVPGGNSFLGFSWADVQAYRSAEAVLAEASPFAGLRVRVGPEDIGPDVTGQLVAPSYFSMLGLEPARGRLDFPPDAAFGEAPSAVLSHAYWTEAYGGDAGVVGRTLRIDGRPVTVQGVAPEGFSGQFIGFPVQLWLPITAADPFLDGFDPDDPSSKPFEMIARLRPGVTLAAAQEALNRVAEQLEAAHPEANRGHRVGVTRTTGLDHSLQAGVTVFAAILSGVSGMVLLIACLNVGSVLLVRTMSREREMAVRLALGAGNGRLVAALVSEAMVLAAAGTALGVWVAVRLNALLGGLVRRLSDGLGLELAVDWTVLSLAAAAAFVAVLAAAAAPAAHLLRKSPAEALRARGGPTRAGTRLRTALVVGQVAVSVVLITATGLFVRALVAGVQGDPGFDADRLGMVTLSLDDDGARPAARDATLRTAVEALERIRGVDGVAVADGPVVGVARSPMEVDIAGVLPPPDQDAVRVDVHRVGAGYLGTVGIDVRAGRDFVLADEAGGPPVAVVSQAFVDRYWPGQEAVGRSFAAGGTTVRVIGVAADARYVVQDETPDPLVYLSLAGRTPGTVVLTLRSTSPETLTGTVRQVVAAALPGHPAVELRPARRTLHVALFPQRIGAVLVGGMGLAALFLAAVGLYGLIQFTVSRDRHELGVRLALGGSRSDLLAVVLRKGFALVAAGTALGAALALVAAPALRPFLAGVSPRDPGTYAAVVLVFGAVGLLASWLPARRAGPIQPSSVLRGE